LLVDKLNLGAPSGRMLGIAKEIYIRGYFNSTRKSVSDSILAILNFDYSAETILKAILLDKNIPIERKTGGYRPFDELIQEIKSAFPQISYLNEIISLHKLRNDVQHHCNIPSDNEVSRHNTTIRLFFDEICQKVYCNSISYNDISLTLFIDSENEKIMLRKMEGAYLNNDYSSVIRYCKRVAIYHVMLIRLSMDAPFLTSFSNRFNWTDGAFNTLGESLEQTNQTVNWIVNKLCLREQYEPVNTFLDGLLGRSFFHFYKGDIEEEQNLRDKAENARNLIYEFITSTQDLVNIADLDSPFIFDLSLTKNASNEAFLQFGIVTSSEIKSAKLTHRRIIKEDSGITHQEQEIIDLPKDSGLHLVPILLKNNERHEFYCQVANLEGKTDDARFSLNN
jgi:hypothetical protein